MALPLAAFPATSPRFSADVARSLRLPLPSVNTLIHFCMGSNYSNTSAYVLGYAGRTVSVDD